MNVLPCNFNREVDAALRVTHLYTTADINTVGVHLRTKAGAVTVVRIDLTADLRPGVNMCYIKPILFCLPSIDN